MGLCYYSMGYPADACVHFKKSIALNAKYEKASSWLTKVSAEIEEKERMKNEIKELTERIDALPPAPVPVANGSGVSNGGGPQA
jgi:prefoldin subunit 5